MAEDDGRVTHYIDEFLTDDLVHNRTEDEVFRGHSSVHVWTLAAYDALRDISQGNDIETAQRKLDDISAKLDVAASLFGPVVAELEAVRDHLSNENAHIRADLHRVNTDLQAAMSLQPEEYHAREQLNAQLQELHAQTHVYAEMMEAKNSELEATSVTLATSLDERERLTGELEASIAHRDTLEQRIVDLQSSNDTTLQVLDQKASALEELEARYNASIDHCHTIEIELAAALTSNHELKAVVQEQQALNDQLERDALGFRGSLEALQTNHNGLVSKIVRLEDAAFDFTIAKTAVARMLARSSFNPLDKISSHRIAKKLIYFGLFDCQFYVSQLHVHGLSVDKELSSNPLASCKHYMKFGCVFGVNPNHYFDNRWYLMRYPDVHADGLNPLWHYFAYGAAEGRDPGPRFSTEAYLRHNPDVAAQNANALSHYLLYGQNEGRLVYPVG
jgi:hypothetical protein